MEVFNKLLLLTMIIECSDQCLTCNMTSTNCTSVNPTLPASQDSYVGATAVSVATSGAVAASTIITGTSLGNFNQ